MLLIILIQTGLMQIQQRDSLLVGMELLYQQRQKQETGGVLLVIGLQNSNRSEQYLLLLHTLEQHVMAVIAHFILMVDIMELHVQVLHMVELMVGHLILRSGLSILQRTGPA